MDVKLRGEQAVPILISHTKVEREPKIKRTRQFVGLKQGLQNLLGSAVALVHESFWEIVPEVLDAGEMRSTHYAVQVSDDPGAGSPELVVTRLDGQGRPGCGAHFEVVTVERPEDQLSEPTQPESSAKAVGRRPKPGDTGGFKVVGGES